MKTKFGTLAVGLVIGLLLLLSPDPSEAQVTNVYNVTGFVDVADLLILQGATIQWHHPGSGAAVGRHSGANQPTTISTTYDGAPAMTNVAWIPTWPQPPPNEIRFNAYSSILSNTTPVLPSGDVSVTVTTLSSRGSLSITQLPVATNGFTLIVRFADGANGAAFISGRIVVSYLPVHVLRLAGSQIELSWATNGPTFGVESTPRLPALSWSVVTNDVIVRDDQFTVTFDPTGTQGFFRLHRLP